MPTKSEGDRIAYTPCFAARIRHVILSAVNLRRIRWSLLILSLVCLLCVLGGVALVVWGTASGEIMGWALIGFFGSGAVVLTRQALAGRRS